MAEGENKPAEITPGAVLSRYEEWEKWLNRFVEVWKKGLVARLLLSGVTLAFILNPAFAVAFANLRGRKPPALYAAIYFTAVGGGFLGLVWLAIFRSTESKTPISATVRRAIKGLSAFGEKDSDLFSRLQRENRIRECCEALTEPEFRLGVLSGVSGAGKTSLVHAGLIPNLRKDGAVVVSVKFTQRDPIKTIRDAIFAKVIPHPELGSQLSLADLLAACFPPGSATTFLFLDQFEQFFVHFKSDDDRRPFREALASWRVQSECSTARMLVCVREEFFRPLNSLFQTIGQPLTRGNSFDLENFSADEASAALTTLSEVEQIEASPRGIALIVESLKSPEDGRIKPADLQMIAESIWRASGDERAFTIPAVQKLGGVEGLRREYLQHILAPLKPQSRREAALHVLSALTEGRTRTGVMMPTQIQDKLAAILSLADVKAAIEFLAHPDNKLISPVEACESYELTHETLIPSIHKLAERELPDREQARRLFNQRTNEWLGNDRAGRFLLEWGEWRKVRRYPELANEVEQYAAAEELLRVSRRRFRCRGYALAVLLLVCVSGWGWWNSTPGYRYRLRQDLIREATTGTNDAKSHIDAALTLFALGDWSSAAALLREDAEKKEAITELCSEISRKSETTDVAPLPDDFRTILNGVKTIADGLTGSDKAHALSDLADAAETAGEGGMAESLFEEAKTVGYGLTGSDKVDTLSILGRAVASAAKAAKDKGLFVEAKSVTDGLTGSDKAKALSNLAVTAATAGEVKMAKGFIEEAITIGYGLTGRDKVDTFSNLATAAARAAKAAKDKGLFVEAKSVTDGLAGSDKVKALSNLAIDAATAGEVEMAKGFIEEAKTIAELPTESTKSDVLSNLAAAAGSAAKAASDKGLFVEAKSVTDGLTGSDKAEALSELARAAANAAKEAKDKGLFDEAKAIADGLTGRNKAHVLSDLADAAATAGEVRMVKGLFEEAKSVTDGLTGSNKAYALSDLAEAAATDGERGMAKSLFEEAKTVGYGLTGRDKVDTLFNLGRAVASAAKAAKDKDSFAEAKSVTDGLAVSDKATALSRLAVTAATAGEVEMAKGFIEEAKTIGYGLTGKDKVDTLSNLATAAARAAEAAKDKGLFEEAKAIADGLTGGGAAYVLSDMADAAATAGEVRMAKGLFEEAKSVADELTDSNKAIILRNLATAATSAAGAAKDIGLFEEAKTIAEELAESDKAEVLLNLEITATRVAEAAEDKSLFEEAKAIADGLTGSNKAIMLRGIATAATSAARATKDKGLFEEAKTIAEALADSDKANALSNLAEAGATAGDAGMAKSLIEEAKSVADGLTGSNKAEAVSNLAIDAMHAGFISECTNALKALSKCDSASSAALGSSVIPAIRIGRLDLASILTEQIHDSKERVEALSNALLIDAQRKSWLANSICLHRPEISGHR